MTFSWHNISEKYNNKSTPQDINFTDGMYLYDDLNDYIQEILDRNGDDKEGIKLSFVLSS